MYPIDQDNTPPMIGGHMEDLSLWMQYVFFGYLKYTGTQYPYQENNGYVKIMIVYIFIITYSQGLRDANIFQGDGLSYAKQINWIYKPL